MGSSYGKVNTVMQISEVAGIVGLSAKTIRYYEAEGVIPEAARLANGYRIYDDSDVQRLRTVAAARSLDLPLEEIRELIELATGGEQPCSHLRTLAETRRELVRHAIDDLVALEAKLTDVIDRSRQVDRQSPIDQTSLCPVLETVSEQPA